MAKNQTLFTLSYDYISKNFFNDISIKDVAEYVGVHQNYLLNAFKKSCGKSIGEVINMMRVYEAQRLLTTTNMSIIDIAFESGFGSLSNFYHCFKNNAVNHRKNINMVTVSQL